MGESESCDRGNFPLTAKEWLKKFNALFLEKGEEECLRS